MLDVTVGAVQRSGAAPTGERDPGDLPPEVATTTTARGPSGGLFAVVLATGGSLVCATFAAAPDSPFQPVLPVGAEPGGPLTAIATALGLDRLAGSWLIAAGVLAMGLAVAGFLVLLRETWRGLVSLRTVIVLAVLANVVVVTMLPLLFSRDVYSYAFYGRIAAVYDENPYVHTPVEFGDDELWPLVGPKWVDTPAVYGPAFTTISGGIARAFDTPAGQVDAYRWLAGLASLATVAAIALTARADPARPRRVRSGRVRAEPGGAVPLRSRAGTTTCWSRSPSRRACCCWCTTERSPPSRCSPSARSSRPRSRCHSCSPSSGPSPEPSDLGVLGRS